MLMQLLATSQVPRPGAELPNGQRGEGWSGGGRALVHAEVPILRKPLLHQPSSLRDKAGPMHQKWREDRTLFASDQVHALQLKLMLPEQVVRDEVDLGALGVHEAYQAALALPVGADEVLDLAVPAIAVPLVGVEATRHGQHGGDASVVISLCAMCELVDFGP
eukprot:CAMPEP_0177534470 /NCGR_PEP_ID=MMETSP0369-20130122/55973_1 /TAXON_ID=447022 ORGANISM="Scrippsiella hangoei-like, Strain SHHI-4" /NCGR_SAMPLE_ID=MMETSP0369 /ASSEMBLY_ACC=CAM_ASM_000364 /LENGTH=162 /DNA_ID=CAMNT_0019016441 /DNA_START=88 /DNA_END=576 /DNA_ORIENTATION=-